MAPEAGAYSPAGVMLRTAAQVRKVAAYRAVAALAIHTAAGPHSPAGAMIHMTGARAYSSAGEVDIPAVLQLHRLYAQVALPEG